MNGSAKLLLDVYRCVHIIVSEQMCTGENRANICVIDLWNPIKPKLFFVVVETFRPQKVQPTCQIGLKKFHLFYGF